MSNPLGTDLDGNPLPTGNPVDLSNSVGLSSIPGLTSQGLSTLLNGILGLGNAGLNAYGGYQALAQQGWNNAAKSTASIYDQGLNTNAQNAANTIAGEYLPNNQSLMNSLTPAYTGGLTQANNALQGGFGGLQNFVTPTQTSQVPGLQGVFDQLGGLQSFGNQALSGTSGIALGTNSNLASALSAALGIGTSNNPLSTALGAGNNLLANGGQNGVSTAAQQAAISSLLNNGQTPLLQQLQALGTQAYNPTNAAQTAINAGTGIVGQNPLLPLSQIASMATDQSATQSNNLLNNLRQQLLNRTGVTGPAVASGQQNQLLDQLGDQALQNQASALSNALTNQQGLQLNLYGQGANLLNQGGNQQLTGQQQALSSLLGNAGQATQNQGTLGNLGLGGLQGVLQSLSTGGNLATDYANTTLGGLNSTSSLLGQQNAGTNALSNLLGTTGGITNQAGQDVFGLQNLGLQQNSAMYNALSNLISGQNTQNNNLQTGLNNSTNQLSNYALANLNQIPSLASSNSSLFTGQTVPQNYFQNLLLGTIFAGGGTSTAGGAGISSGLGQILNGLGLGSGGSSSGVGINDPYGLGSYQTGYPNGAANSNIYFPPTEGEGGSGSTGETGGYDLFET